MSGGSDSVLTVWRDDTSDKAAAAARDDETRITLTQELSNNLAHKNYRAALRLAIALKQVSLCGSVGLCERLVAEISACAGCLVCALFYVVSAHTLTRFSP